MHQIIPLTKDIYLCQHSSIKIVKFVYFMNSVKNVVHSLPLSFKNHEINGRALLSLKHVSVFSIHLFEHFPF